MAQKEEKAQESVPAAAEEPKRVYRKTATASEIETVQMKKKLPVKKPATKAVPVRTRRTKSAPARNIGIPMAAPERRCEDRFCPYHGKLSVRGIILDVQIVSRKMQGTVVVKRERRHYVKKYQRYEKRTSRYLAHLPGCLDVDVGDMVRIVECRPLSKSTSFVVIGRL